MPVVGYRDLFGGSGGFLLQTRLFGCLAVYGHLA